MQKLALYKRLFGHYLVIFFFLVNQLRGGDPLRLPICASKLCCADLIAGGLQITEGKQD